jgi:hypothetical protein
LNKDNKTNSIYIIWRYVLVLWGLALNGCNAQIYDPHYWHTNFVGGLQSNVGKSFQKRLARGGSGGWIEDGNFTDRKSLPNGHIMYNYRAGGTCRYSFEVDPETDIIVAANWEGEERHCILMP